MTQSHDPAPDATTALQAEIALLERVRRRQSQAVVVDDIRSARILLAQALKAAGFTKVLRAADGQAGLELMERESCDLALVDWDMPRLDGLALLDQVRAHPRLAPMVFLLVTADHADARVRQAAEESQDAFLRKPISADDLARRLDLVVGRRLACARSRLLETQGRGERAAEVLLMALHNQPRLRWPVMALGGLMARQGRWAEAERCYARVLELDPQALGALVEMGRLRQQQGDGRQARRLHRQAMAGNPLFFRARDALADSLAAEGREAEALTVLEEALAQGGGANAFRQERLAGLAYAQGLYQRAEEALEAAQGLKPARVDPANRLLLARARLARGLQDEALTALAQAAQAAQAAGDDPALAEAQARLAAEAEACSRLGLSLVARGRLDEAQAQYQRGLALLPGSGRLHFNLGKLHLRRGDQEQALPALAAAARLAAGGQDWELAAQTAALLADLGHVPQARALLQQALTQAPNEDPDLVRSLALALASLNRPQQADP